MKRLIVFAAALLFCASAFAQFNVNLGYVNSTDFYKAGNEKITTKDNGFTVGIGYSLELADDFYFTPGLNYILLSSPVEISPFLHTRGQSREHYINIPLTLSFDFNIASGSKIFVFAGPTASIGLASSYKITTDVQGLGGTIDNYADGDYKRFDIMLGGGAGFKFSDKYCIKVGYDYGLINRSAVNGLSLHRGQLTASVAYMF